MSLSSKSVIFLSFIIFMLCGCGGPGDSTEQAAVEHIKTADYPWEILSFWEERGYRDRTLYHISGDSYITDGHSSLFAEWDDIPDVRDRFDFIRAANRKRIISRLIWVVPYHLKSKREAEDFLYWKGFLPGDFSDLEQSGEAFDVELMNIPAAIAGLSHIPVSREKVLVNFDPSFFNSLLLRGKNDGGPDGFPRPEDIVDTMKEKKLTVEAVSVLGYKHYRGHPVKLAGHFTAGAVKRRFEDLQGNPDEKDTLLWKAFDSYAGKDHGRALSLLERADAVTPGYYLLRILTEIGRGNPRGCASAFTGLVSADAGFADLEGRIGDFILHSMGKEQAGIFYKVLEKSAVEEKRSSSEAEGPDGSVLLITVDTLRADALGCYGNDVIETPAADGLAEEGFLFTNAYCPIPQTGPSHAAILTGQYPSTMNMLDNGIRLDRSFVTMAEVLYKKGARTAAFVSGYPLDAVLCGLDRGFERYDDDFTVKTFGGEKLERRADETTSAALEWLGTLKNGEKFFLWVHYYDPHGPYVPPAPYEEKYAGEQVFGAYRDGGAVNIPSYQKLERGGDPQFYRSRYAGEVSYTDEQIGRLLQGVKKQNIYDGTAVVFTADHGESLGEDYYYFDHGNNLNEASVRVPLIIRIPGAEPGRSGETAELIDITPTLLDWLNLQGETEYRGNSLLPLLAGEVFPGGAAFMTTGIVYQRNPRAGYLLAMVRDGYKLVYPLERGEVSLYSTDERERYRKKNLVTEKGALADEMAESLIRWWADSKPVRPKNPDLKEEEKERLESLGYLGG